MPEIHEPKKVRYICCCDYDPPGLRCGECTRHNHEGCLDPMKISSARTNLTHKGEEVIGMPRVAATARFGFVLAGLMFAAAVLLFVL